ncbi:MAG: hypothetical protein OXB86_01625 [Bdellovibrionales bacterium]|nr:hypothetical protein [Bdellovibrionales bacterium]
MKLALKATLLTLILTGAISLLFFGVFFFSAKVEIVELKMDPQFKDSHWTPELKQKFLSHINNHKGQRIWTVPLDQMARDLRELYPAAELRIQRQLPDRIIIFLKKSNPLLLLLREQGDQIPISFQGDLQPPLDSNQFMDLPILRGDLFYKNPDLRREICALIRKLPDKGLLTSKNISEITYNKKRKSFLLFLIPGYTSVEVSSKLSEKQILKINFVLKYLLQREMMERTVDARFEKKIIVSIPHSS